MKKVSVLLLMIFLMTVLAGCSNDNIKITEDESNAIAQYCSYLLLKYDKKQLDDTKLLDERTFAKEMKKREEAENKASKAPVVTEEPEPTDVVSEPDITDVPTPIITDSPNEPDKPDEPVVTAEPEPIENNITLEEVLGLSDFTIEYKQTVVADSYNTDDKFFSMTATEGQNLAVVEFTVKNITNSDVRLDMTEKDVKFVLTDDQSRTHEPVISFLTNDLRFYNEVIPAGKSVDTCLVFYIKSDVQPVTLKIIGVNTYTINLN